LEKVVNRINTNDSETAEYSPKSETTREVKNMKKGLLTDSRKAFWGSRTPLVSSMLRSEAFPVYFLSRSVLRCKIATLYVSRRKIKQGPTTAPAAMLITQKVYLQPPA